TSLERGKILEEYAETERAIQRYREILADEREVSRIIVEELRAVRAKYADPRRTEIVDEVGALSVEDLIVEEDMVVTISHEGYIMSYASPRPSGIIAIALEDADEVIGVRLTDGAGEAILSTRDGQAIRFKESDVRPMGRDTYGVRGMRLDEGDEVVALDLVEPGATLLAVSENGFGKRTEMDEYRLTRRGGKGIITMRTTDKTGRVEGVRMVTD